MTACVGSRTIVRDRSLKGISVSRLLSNCLSRIVKISYSLNADSKFLGKSRKVGVHHFFKFFAKARSFQAPDRIDFRKRQWSVISQQRQLRKGQIGKLGCFEVTRTSAEAGRLFAGRWKTKLCSPARWKHAEGDCSVALTVLSPWMWIKAFSLRNNA